LNTIIPGYWSNQAWANLLKSLKLEK